jgi:hypothetical protein
MYITEKNKRSQLDILQALKSTKKVRASYVVQGRHYFMYLDQQFSLLHMYAFSR